MIKLIYLTAAFMAVFSLSSAQKKIVKPELPAETIFQQIDSLDKAGLPRSAFALTEELYQRALKTKNSALLIKTMVLRMKYREDITEESLVVFVGELENQLPDMWEPARQITHSMLGDLYQWYYARNRWQLLEQRQVDTGSRDIREMSVGEISARAVQHYRLSLENPALLQSEELKKYQDILLDESGKFNLRPTLFDFLSVKAVEALLSDALFQEPAEPNPVFENRALIGSVDQFLKIKFPEDKAEGSVQGLILLQNWLAFRQKEQEKEPLFDADLTRLKLLVSYYTGEDQETLYEESLKKLAEKSKGLQVCSDVQYQRALFLQQLGNSGYGQETGRNYLKEALSIARQGLKAWPKSEGGALCSQLIQEITLPRLALQMEENIPSQAPITYRLDYNNVNQVYLNLYRLDAGYEEINNQRFIDRQFVERLNTLKPLKTEMKTLPDFGDYLNHSAELDLEYSTGPGRYVLVVSPSPIRGGIDKLEVISYAFFQVTNLSVFSKSLDDGRLDVLALNRTTGMPVKEVAINVFGNNRRERDTQIITSTVTGADGRVQIPIPDQFRNVSLEAIQGDDRFRTNNIWLEGTSVDNDEKSHSRVFIFTDRAIYRPGQTVWYKAVVLETNGKAASVLKEQYLTLTLHDVNHQELAAQTLVTNDFGSVSGSFIIPNNILTGRFSIQSPRGSHHFRVENYKRPRFEVTMDPFKAVVVLGDEVHTTGKAVDLTGAPLQAARVRWKVTRVVRLWRTWGRNQPVAIASGSGVTDSQGAFELGFTAVSSIKKKSLFPESFLVEVEVTDVNGETRSATQTIIVGHQGVEPQVQLLQNQFVKAVDSLPVNFTLYNQNRELVNGNIRYRVSQLSVPEQVLPTRYWESADTVLWKNLLVNREDEKGEAWQQWPEQQVVKSGEMAVNGELYKVLAFDSKLTCGVYKITIETLDKSGEMRKDEAVFYIWGTGDQVFNPGKGLIMYLNKEEVKTGESIEIKLTTAFKKGKVLLLVTHENSIVLEKTVQVEELQEPVIIPATTDLEGTINIRALFVQQNRVYMENQIITVQNPARQLQLKLTSFRDKVKPGSQENWTLTVNDGNNEIADAEVLALMYDASLDYYSANYLNMDWLYPRYGFKNWRYDGFHVAWGIDQNKHRIKPVNIILYPTFNWQGYSWGVGGRFGNGGPRLLKSVGAVQEEEGESLFMITDESEEEIVPISRQDAAPREPSSAVKQTEQMMRRQFQETAFFMPQLTTDDNGEVQFSFTMPESVTRWRFMALAHRADGVSGNIEQFVTASRELMVMPNLPRIVREGDELTLSTKIINTTDTVLAGTAWLKVRDAITGLPISGEDLQPVNWKLKAGQLTTASWSLKIPSGTKGLYFSVSAGTEEFQDGEEHLVPVLPVKMLITETLPVSLSGKGKHTIRMESLLNSKRKEHESFTFTYTQNAAWEMLGALPWLMERPHENSDQVFNRYFAVTVAQKIFADHPQIEQVLKAWAAALPGDEDALLSALEKNPELKSTLLSATPWLTDAKNDSERRRRLASLVTAGSMDTEKVSALSKLRNLQLSDGSWPWFSGMDGSLFVTSEIVAGFGYLKKMGVSIDPEAERTFKRAVVWLQNQLRTQRDQVLKRMSQQKDSDNVVVPDWGVIKSLYALSFFNQGKLSDGEQFWMEKMKRHYKVNDVTGQAMAALIFSRYGFTSEAKGLVASINEKAISGESGQWFYKSIVSPFWHQAPVERQVVVLEALRELEPSSDKIAGMEDWLIGQKRTQSWPTTRATVAAVYGLATSTRNLFGVQKPDQIKIGNYQMDPQQVVSGSGYFTHTWNGLQVKPSLGSAVVKKQSSTPSWASMHWNYWEEEAQVEQGGFLEVKKQVFKRAVSNGEETWLALSDTTQLSPGDRLMVRLLIETPQALDFVHVNDKRASVLEPVTLLSGYEWKSGLGYYVSITDAGTDFFIDHLPKGKFNLSYEVVVSHKGKASSGPATVSCFYAPEFSGHSGGSFFKTN